MNIVWDDDAKARLKEIVLYGVDNWGLKVAKAFYENIINIEERLTNNPGIGHPEPLLANRTFEYRAVIIQKNFKLIYRVDHEKEIILIADLWDTRREPRKLAKRVKNQ
ncbi:MAG: type II toxin-antitoxin system RelE/ParE family toxin [Parabacteroides sp.]|nr:type II toxin-antitoxin system RelE/ParE family toxin [Parabacteroides sp.]